MLGECAIRAMLATVRPEAAKRFYTDVLGLRVVADHAFAIMLEGGGALLHLQKVDAFTPHPFTALGFTVDDVHATAAALRDRGVVFERFPGMDQDEDGVWVPPGGRAGVCWFKDPDGNLLSLTQPDLPPT